MEFLLGSRLRKYKDFVESVFIPPWQRIKLGFAQNFNLATLQALKKFRGESIQFERIAIEID